MALIDIKLPSGYVIEPESIESYKPDKIKRFEINSTKNLATLYIDKLTNSGLELKLEVNLENKIEECKAGYVSVFDYYEDISK